MLFGYIYQEFALVSLKPKYFKPCLRIYIEKKQKQNKNTETDNRLVVRGREGGLQEGKMGKRDQLYGDEWK